MKVIYKSIDGCEFDTEKECVEYEKELSNLVFYDINLMIVYDHRKAAYFEVRSEKGMNNLRDMCIWRDTTTRGLDEPGIYAYSSEGDGLWVNLDKVVDTIRGGK